MAKAVSLRKPCPFEYCASSPIPSSVLWRKAESVKHRVFSGFGLVDPVAADILRILRSGNNL
jgi:hypothetical protein